MCTADARVTTSPALAGLFHGWPRVAACELRLPGDESTLHPEEARSIDAVSTRRRREFAAGQSCARRALAEIGVPSAPLLPSKGGIPGWPKGTTGSISHTRGYCGAVVMPQVAGVAIGIGIDVEPIGAVVSELYPILFTTAERAWLSSLTGDEQPLMSTTLFTAKEAFYKAQYAITGSWVDFPDVSVLPDAHGLDIAKAAYLPAFARIQWPPSVRTTVVGNLALTGVIVERWDR